MEREGEREGDLITFKLFIKNYYINNDYYINYYINDYYINNDY